MAWSSRNHKALPNWHESNESARISWSTMRSSLVCFSLWNKDRWRPARTSEDRQRPVKTSEVLHGARASAPCLWGSIHTLSKLTHPLKPLLQQSITCPPCVCFSQTSSHKTPSRKTSHNWVSKETRNFHFSVCYMCTTYTEYLGVGLDFSNPSLTRVLNLAHCSKAGGEKMVNRTRGCGPV